MAPDNTTPTTTGETPVPAQAAASDIYAAHALMLVQHILWAWESLLISVAAC